MHAEGVVTPFILYCTSKYISTTTKIQSKGHNKYFLQGFIWYIIILISLQEIKESHQNLQITAVLCYIVTTIILSSRI